MGSKEQFETRLREFFEKNKRSKLRFVPRILEQFSEHEEHVMTHLHKKYKVPLPGEELQNSVSTGRKYAEEESGKTEHHSIPEPASDDGTATKQKEKNPMEVDSRDNQLVSEEAKQPVQKKKKSKKILALIIILIIFSSGGVAAYLFKDQIMENIPGNSSASVVGEDGEEAEKAENQQEEVIPEQEVAKEPEAEEVIVDEPVNEEFEEEEDLTGDESNDDEAVEGE